MGTYKYEGFENVHRYETTRVRHGYTAGTDFIDRTRTRVHRTRGGYGYIPYRFTRGMPRNPRYTLYPRVRTPPTSLQPRESSPHTSIDVAVRFARYWIGWEEEEEGASLAWWFVCIKYLVSHHEYVTTHLFIMDY
jgi:hypothetical protein